MSNMLLAELISEIESIGRDGLVRAGRQYVREVRSSILAGLDAYDQFFTGNSPATIKRKGKDTPLIDKGKLLNSFVVTREGSLGVLIANKQPYSGKHNDGLGVPRRTFLDAEVAAKSLLASLVTR